MKPVRVILSTFYGHLLALAVYDLIISGTVDCIASSNNYYYNTTRILLGLVLILLSVFTIFILTIKRFKALYFCGGVLSLVLIGYVVIYTLYLIFNFKTLDNLVKYSLLVESIIKVAVMASGLALTFFMAARGPYALVDDTNSR